MPDFLTPKGELTRFLTQPAPLETLDQILPRLLQNLSLARAQIVIDHLRGVVQSRGLQRIVFVTAAAEANPDEPLAAAIALTQPVSRQHDTAGGSSADAATVLHAGLLEPADQPDADAICEQLSRAVDRDLADRGVGFVQWATDAAASRDNSVARWCEGCGFREIATLDYMSGEVATDSDSDRGEDAVADLGFQSIDLDDPAQLEQLEQLVARTYHQTLDCPKLAEYRTAAQTLSGYRASDAYQPNLWFRVTVASNPREPVGCLILGRHASQESNQPPVIEIVYMGLIPESRGKGRGRALVAKAVAETRGCGAQRMILAVDQENQPARDIYQAFGLQPLLSETVWVKTLGQADK